MVVGRRLELERLISRLGERRPLVLLGEAGVGKTTLVRAAAAAAEVALVEAGSLASLSWLPYLPLRRAFGHDFTGDAAYVSAAVEDELGDRALFLDDVHWADASTAALLPYLAGRVRLVAAVRRGDAATGAAVARCADAGVELLPVEPLDDEDAAILARALHPGLAATAARRLVVNSGGNPFLLEHLAPTGEAAESLRLAVAARLRGLSPEARDAMAALALLGRPGARRLVGTGADELVDAGLVSGDRELAIRHALLADAAAATLSDDERRAIHARLAPALDDPGEAARHYAAAGADEPAREHALRAAARAATPGERAAHLELACACGAPAELEAAQALLAAGEPARALAIATRIDGTDAALVECAAAVTLGDADRGRAAWERAVASASPDPHVTLQIRMLEAETAAFLDDNAARAAEAAEDAYELAVSLDTQLPRALGLRGRSRLATGAPGWQDDLERSVAAALATSDAATALDAGRSLVFGLLIDGKPAAGAETATRLADEARRLHLTAWEREFRYALAGFSWHAGDAQRAVEITADLASEEGARDGLDSWFYRAQALIELGRFVEADVVLAPVRTVAEERTLLRHLLWADSDLAFWGGNAKHALRLAERCLALPGMTNEGPPLFVRVTQAWAAIELGADPGPPVVGDRAVYGMGAAIPVEERALLQLARGEHRAAADAFGEAAELWRGRHSRGELRCLWGRGEALRRGHDEAAVRELELAEARANELDGAAVRGRVERSLRLAGVRRSAARTHASGITGRESQVLALVAQGLTNDVIARRLGIGRPTVVRLIRSAQQKLGATSRGQAAALAAKR